MRIDLQAYLSDLAEDAYRKKLFEIVIQNDQRKWQAIRAIYKSMRTGKYAPYPVNWTQIFTPIEHMAWGDIRWFGLPFYPQYPVGHFFADFADPETHIVIECDGKKFHDPLRDAERDKLMQAEGWRVFRVSGADCYRKIYSPLEVLIDDETDFDDACVTPWAMQTIGGLAWSLAVIAYGYSATPALHELATRVLNYRESVKNG